MSSLSRRSMVIGDKSRCASNTFRYILCRLMCVSTWSQQLVMLRKNMGPVGGGGMPEERHPLGADFEILQLGLAPLLDLLLLPECGYHVMITALLYYPAMMDCISCKLWAKINPFSSKWSLSGYFILASSEDNVYVSIHASVSTLALKHINTWHCYIFSEYWNKYYCDRKQFNFVS